MACPPASAIMAAVSLIVSGRLYGEGRPLTLRPVQYTVAPASPSARAMPRPAPRVAPATSATRPARGLRDDLPFVMPSPHRQIARVHPSRAAQARSLAEGQTATAWTAAFRTKRSA